MHALSLLKNSLLGGELGFYRGKDFRVSNTFESKFMQTPVCDYQQVIEAFNFVLAQFPSLTQFILKQVYKITLGIRRAFEWTKKRQDCSTLKLYYIGFGEEYCISF